MTHSNDRPASPSEAASADGASAPMASASSTSDQRGGTATSPGLHHQARRRGSDTPIPTLGQCAAIVLSTAVIVALTVRWIGAVETLVVVGITAALVLVILTLRTPPAEPWTQFTALFRLLTQIFKDGGSDQP